VRARRRAAGPRPPDDALFAWLRAFVAHVAAKRDLALALPDDGQRSEFFQRWHQAMHSSASALLTLAQDAGVVRADLTSADLLAAANGIALTSAPGPQTERLLALIRRGATAEP
jgi:hypothetical protein